MVLIETSNPVRNTCISFRIQYTAPVKISLKVFTPFYERVYSLQRTVSGVTTQLLHAIFLVVYRLEAMGREITEPVYTVTRYAKEVIAPQDQPPKIQAVQVGQLEMHNAWVSCVNQGK